MIRCIALDDEPLALDIIKAFVQKVSGFNLLRVFTDVFEASAYLKVNEVDLIFLDINMPDINGIRFYESLQDPPALIFTTAYSQYALKGFDLDAIDYLLKPISFERFEQALKKVKAIHELKSKQNQIEEDSIFVRAEYALVKIPIADIQYIESLGDYVKIYVGQKPIITHSTMKSILEKLPEGKFSRVHRSYAVPHAKIDSIRNRKIYIGAIQIPIGDTYFESLNKQLN
ncbi:MAG: LytR/AlgR family response regulator transcription factor [Bacteroidia bacterium]